MKRTAAPPTIRYAHPLAFCAFLSHIGAPVERYLRRQGLPTLCDDPDGLVPLSRAWSFFDAAAQYEDNMIGWQVGQFVGDHNLNHTLLRQLEGAPTLYQALRQMVSMVSSEASHLQLGILERGRDILFYTHYPDRKEDPGYLTSQAYQLEAYLSLVRHFLGKHLVPPEIGFEHPSVPRIVEDHFRRARIRPGSEFGYLTVPRSCLHVSAANANRGGVGDHDFTDNKKLDYIDALRLLLEPYLAEGYISQRFAASLMDTSERTLTRRLSERGLSYASLLDEVRFNAARGMLQNPDIKIVDVARSIGFEDHSNFTRMFRRVGGLTPREFRRASQIG